MDVLTGDQRHKNMVAIRSKNTKPEIFLRKRLFAEGYRYRVNAAGITGHPDIYLKKYNTAIFINGCFWHRHENCRYATVPATRKDFWLKKFETNVKRDNFVKAELKNAGIKCLIVWECTIKKMKKDSAFESAILMEIQKFLIEKEYCYKEL